MFVKIFTREVSSDREETIELWRSSGFWISFGGGLYSPSALVKCIVNINIQDAELLQRDRAAGCGIVFAKSRDWNWETIFYGYRSIFNHCDIIGLKICQIR